MRGKIAAPKKKFGRPPKKKVMESFMGRKEHKQEIEMPSEVEPKPTEPVSPSVAEKSCECGKPVHPGTPQCWECAHRP